MKKKSCFNLSSYFILASSSVSQIVCFYKYNWHSRSHKWYLCYPSELSLPLYNITRSSNWRRYSGYKIGDGQTDDENVGRRVETFVPNDHDYRQ